jgi:predicted house-cleaning noncanonical NTP pyrophosphatase (MazG superfamily)
MGEFKMILGTIDTCTWINVASDQYNDNGEILNKLELMVYSGKFQLLLPEIIINEWDKHKQEKVINRLNVSLSSKLKNFREIKEYLEDNEVDQLTQLISSITGKQTYFENVGKERVERIEKLFSYKTTKIIPIIDEVKVKAVELALLNKKPFAKKKNSIGDALIFLSVIEYMRGMKIPLYFITDNKEDFGAQNQTELHDDLKKLVEQIKLDRNGEIRQLDLNYFINIATALNSIQENIISRETEKLIQASLNRPLMEYVQNKTICGKCKSVLDDRNNGMWKHSMYGGGLSWWIMCHKCGTGYDTGEYFD